ncbi:hypothetical protein HanRHA438_Chr02g0086411 [Helianthus annuus]|nr:hypothetical protein HanHA300_Chr02g0062501 [Helianthus annuus]KAJ0616179.1 hypothetical protein HanIR_Chr02g0087691 [Helianthus annuus]KAJ0619408.1 hypothetical protein HanHA89_Chr02g0071061 [Helianthus annuus]KAJ0777858.1 hypothetical protein HanLR1_Chr02g0065291 [Helianthus annuus]KAJ0786871.1 hypothetical protein HanOQP8_Chr02g0076241 [Helianthus annuus]
MQRKKIYMTSELRTALDHNFQLFFDILFKQDVENLSGVSYCASLARSEAMFANLGHLVCLCMASRNEVVKRVPWVRWVGLGWVRIKMGTFFVQPRLR